jgi:hypothetical protein
MSTTTSITPVVPTSVAANTPKASITAANTSADVVRAMIDDPAIRSSILNAFTTILGNKSLVGSKTTWIAILVPVVMSLSAHFGLAVDQAAAVDVVGLIMGVAMIVMRWITKTPVASLLPSSDPISPPPMAQDGAIPRGSLSIPMPTAASIDTAPRGSVSFPLPSGSTVVVGGSGTGQAPSSTTVTRSVQSPK